MNYLGGSCTEAPSTVGKGRDILSILVHALFWSLALGHWITATTSDLPTWQYRISCCVRLKRYPQQPHLCWPKPEDQEIPYSVDSAPHPAQVS